MGVPLDVTEDRSNCGVVRCEDLELGLHVAHRPEDRDGLGRGEGDVVAASGSFAVDAAELRAGSRIVTRHELEERIGIDRASEPELGLGSVAPPLAVGLAAVEVVAAELLGVVRAGERALERLDPHGHW